MTAGMQGSLVRCPGGCNSSQIWRRELTRGIAVAFINLGSSAVGQLCLSRADLRPLDTSALVVRICTMSIDCRGRHICISLLYT